MKKISKFFFSTLNKQSPISLPTINISEFLSNSSEKRKNTASMIIEASERYGAFLISNSNISCNSTLNSMNYFFNQPQSIKDLIKLTNKGFTRGYIGIGEESGSDLFERKEGFSYGYDWPLDKSPENPLQGCNVWPVNQIEWRKSMNSFYQEMCDLAKNISSAISLGLGFKENYLPEFCKEGDTISLMRLFHYFPYLNKDEIGSSPHTDWGFLTLILQENNVEGLQIWDNNEWKTIQPIENTIVVNCGDYLSLLTNGRLKSPLHRVINNGKERISAVLFYYPSFNAKIPIIPIKNISLFKNQLEGSKDINTQELLNKSFGEYILEKWTQVSRTGKTY